jgi:hypothetical protein
MDVDETDGYERDAPVGIRLAQALPHGTGHRSQICTALTSLGLEPTAIERLGLRPPGWSGRRDPAHVLKGLEDRS